MLKLKRLEFPCPTCDAEIGKFCISKTGQEMGRFAHPDRGFNEMKLENIIRLRSWLMDYADIFRLPDD